jgi:hypothetical protein
MHPLIEVGLKDIQVLIELFAESNSVKRILHCAVQALTDAIGFRVTHFGLVVINIL